MAPTADAHSVLHAQRAARLVWPSTGSNSVSSTQRHQQQRVEVVVCAILLLLLALP